MFVCECEVKVNEEMLTRFAHDAIIRQVSTKRFFQFWHCFKKQDKSWTADFEVGREFFKSLGSKFGTEESKSEQDSLFLSSASKDPPPPGSKYPPLNGLA